MDQGPRVLIVAKDLDPAADLLVEEFATRGVAVMRFDLADFPQRVQLVAEQDGSWRGVLSDDHRTARLEDIGAILWRDPGSPVIAGAEAFVANFDLVICKPLAGAQLEHADGHRTAVPTHLIDVGDLDESITVTAHYLQEWIPKRHEVRLIVVGGRFFAATIHAGSDAAYVDWRTDYDALTYETTAVPDEVRRSVCAWMRRFGLTFGAFDFAVTPDDEWVMFECNPAGQWGWIQDRTDLPISAAIAEHLIGGLG